jgi:chromatin structure-remodeling complex subunit SFH1
MLKECDTPEMLVPITIDIDIPSPTGDGNGIKIKDRFLWNAADMTMKPSDFAVILCDDLGIKDDQVDIIASLIQTQLDEAQPASFIDLQTEDVTPDDVVWSEDEAEEEVEENKLPEPDCRIVINVS